MVTYSEFKKENSKEIDEFISKYFVFAFSKEQHEKVLKKLGLTDEEFQAQSSI